MKCQVPGIYWHGREPILSIDFQPGKRNVQRLATGSVDCHLLIWYLTYQENKSVNIVLACDLNRHTRSVNAVRFSPNGDFLASADDDGAIYVWQLKEEEHGEVFAPLDEGVANKEDWYPVKLLRGHLSDIHDICWSSDGNFMVSASMDNTSIVWDMQKYQKVHIFSDAKGFVQGVAFDPLNTFIASVGSDRALRIYNINTKRTAFNVQRAPWSIKTEKGTTIRARLFYDDTLKSFNRKLCFTPDGELLIVPSGIKEREEEKFQNTTYVFSRHALNKPAIHLPSGDKCTTVVRCNPFLYKLRTNNDDNTDKENVEPKSKPMIDLPYRMIFAVAAAETILLYDTQQLLPFAYVSSMHYARITDLTWSPDGRTLAASSTDESCSFLTFTEEELGEVYIPPVESPAIVNDENPATPSEKKSAVSVDKKPSVFDLLENQQVKTVESEVPREIDVNPKHFSPSAIKTSMEVPKSNKKPKLCTIKNFFASPKARLAENKVATPINQNVPQDSPLVNTINSEPGLKKTPAFKPKVSGTVPAETMEVDGDSCSIEVVFESKDPCPSVEKKPKCKTQLNFTGEICVKKNVSVTTSDVDLDNSDAVLSFEDTPMQKNLAVVLEKDANDWKLELSQDETPMEVEPVASTSSTLPEVAKPLNVKPKRRIALTTLSKTLSK